MVDEVLNTWYVLRVAGSILALQLAGGVVHAARRGGRGGLGLAGEGALVAEDGLEVAAVAFDRRLGGKVGVGPLRVLGAFLLEEAERRHWGGICAALHSGQSGRVLAGGLREESGSWRGDARHALGRLMGGPVRNGDNCMTSASAAQACRASPLSAARALAPSSALQRLRPSPVAMVAQRGCRRCFARSTTAVLVR